VNVHPIRRWYAAIVEIGARETAIKVTSRWFKWVMIPLTLSNQKEHAWQAASSVHDVSDVAVLGLNMA
jgi:hypothetical protein